MPSFIVSIDRDGNRQAPADYKPNVLRDKDELIDVVKRLSRAGASADAIHTVVEKAVDDAWRPEK